MKRKTVAFISENAFDYYQTRMLSGARSAANELDLNLVRFSIENSLYPNRLNDQLEIVVSLMQEFNPDGLMFLGWSGDIQNREKEFLTMIRERFFIPIASIGRVINGVPSIRMSEGCFNQLLEHLYNEHQFRRIVFIEPHNPDDRYQEYVKFMQQRGIYDDSLIVHANILTECNDWLFKKRAIRIAEILLDERKIIPDVIMSMFTYEAFFLLEELKRRGFNIPEDIALTSWEDGERGRYATPSLTSVYYPFFEQGYEGVKLIARLLRGEDVPMSNSFGGSLNIRRSCGCVPEKVGRAYIHNAQPQKTKSLDFISNRQLLLDELNKSINILNSDELLESFETQLQSFDGQSFIRYIEKKIHANISDILNIYTIQDEVLTFRAIISPYLGEQTKQINNTCNIWLQSQIVIQENIEGALGLSQTIEKGNSYIRQEIGHGIVTSLDLQKILNIFENGLWKIGVTNCLIVLHNQKNFEKGESKPTFIYLNQQGVSQNDARYKLSSKALISKMLADETTNHTLLSFIMHINFELVGYIIFEIEPQSEDESVFHLLSSQLCSSIYGAKMLSTLRRINNDLSSAQTKIIKNMQEIQEKTVALEQSNEKLSQLDSLKNDFFANITHDFRSPLTVILNNAELGLKNETEYSIPMVKKRYSAIVSASLKLKEIIDRLLELAKMDAQGVKLKIQKIDIKKYLIKTADFFRSAVSSSAIEIKIDFPYEGSSNFYTDPVKLDEVLHNVLSNAIKYVDPNKGLITISFSEDVSRFAIKIADNGIGIPKDKLETIFNRFEQLDSAQGGLYKGTGIGLVFTRQLVGFLGGTIRAESEGLGKGANFIIELNKIPPSGLVIDNTSQYEPEIEQSDLKYKQAHDIIETSLLERLNDNEPIYHFGQLNRDNEFDPKKGVIVVIDDNCYILEIVQEYLRNADYNNYVLANNGKAGIEAIYNTHPDLVLSDYNMPKMRGDQIHDLLCTNPDFIDLPFIFMTAVSSREIILDRRLKGAIGFLKKPLNEREFIVNVNAAMKKHMEFKKILKQATSDSLTGLANKQTIFSYLLDKLCLRIYRKISVIFLDIDNFKDCNDTYGHQTGDIVLASIGKLIAKVLRSYDRAGRFGGEEFLIVLPEADMQAAQIAAEKLCELIAKQTFNKGDKTFSITASFGVASLTDNESYISNNLKITKLNEIFEVVDVTKADWEYIDSLKEKIAILLIDMADKALYQAKQTTCKSCGYSSTKWHDFQNGKCSNCESLKLNIGRNRVVGFKG
ncbi:MAG: diguanylate cyclase [Deltaproteobacteria bacterium]|nr:diguanylate cyclase [Deltaproteobacteria bacterium]